MGLLNNLISIPIPTPYLIIAKILISLALLVGAYFYGYHRADTIITDQYQLKISQYENDKKDLALKLEQEHSLVEQQVVVLYMYEIQTMEKRKMVYVNQAGEVPAQHTLSNGWVYLHNQAALGLDADDNKVKDPSSSGVMDNEALSTVVENYTSCHEKDTQIASLRDYLHKMQDYVDKVKDAVDKANKSPYKPLFK